MVNYVNDPFGASQGTGGGSSGGTGGTNSTAEFGASSYRVDQNSHEVVSSLEQSRISAAASHMDAFCKGSRFSASNEALNKKRSKKIKKRSKKIKKDQKKIKGRKSSDNRI